jgi:nitroreductase
MPLSSDDLAELIRARRTINSFRPEPVPVEVLRQAIDTAVWAPNHKLTEPWRFHLLGPETVTKLIELNASLVAASKGEKAADEKRRRWSAVPGWFAVTCPRSGDPVRNDEDYAACCCAVQNLALLLWSQGVGMKWSTGEVTRRPEVFGWLGLSPETTRIVGLFWYGFPSETPKQKRLGSEDVLKLHP